MNVTIKDRWLWFAFIVGITAAVVFAGTTNLQTLALTPEVSTDNALVINNSSGTNKLVVGGAGVMTASGGLVVAASSAPAQTSSTSVGLFWLADGTACGATDEELYYFKSASTGFVAVEDGSAVICW